MKIEIFDVGHGGCALITGPRGGRIMLDCGYRMDPSWFPSVTFAGETIDLLALMNLDEDHLNDLPYLWRDVRINAIYSNPTVTASALKAMKTQGMREGAEKAHELLKRFGPGLSGPIANMGAEVWAYSNSYGTDFTKTNDLSLAVFARFGAFTILFGGDLECAGWRKLLENPYFRADLATVNVFVASHHGRENGQCPELFKIARPDIVIFSDDRKKYDTQNTDAWYRQRVKGIPRVDVPADPLTGIRKRRHVMTTRRDGTMTINVEPSGSYLITPAKQEPALTLASLFQNPAPSLGTNYLQAFR